MTVLDTTTGRLTPEQRVASASSLHNAFIEAEPGSGKTTVAAQRFGVLRYSSASDDRAVLAVSFTRSATAELRARVRRIWGPSALQWPHRVSTIDFLMRRLVSNLLIDDHIRWPSGHTELEVTDDWRTVAAVTWSMTEARVGLVEREVVVSSGRAASRRLRPTVASVRSLIGDGTCTHDDVRSVLADALDDPDLALAVRAHLANSVRALIVDEVFDGNKLDLAIVELAMEAGLDVTIIGDPWQALYGFRGARPEDVPDLVARTHMRRLPLTASFRWETDEQRELAADLRQGIGIVLPEGRVADANVVLASQWKYLWAVGNDVLPLGFSPGDNEEGKAAETLILNQVARNTFQLDATALGESLKALGLVERSVIFELEPELNEVVEALRSSPDDPVRPVFALLSNAIQNVVGYALGTPIKDDLVRLRDLRTRLLSPALTPGLTIHQAKGREWDYVGVRLDARETQNLEAGLVPTSEPNRKTYVASTRARRRTFMV